MDKLVPLSLMMLIITAYLCYASIFLSNFFGLATSGSKVSVDMTEEATVKGHNQAGWVGKWNCTDGGCIVSSELCDGVKDCADGSDETVEQCGRTLCTGDLFRCTYGACVHNAAACNGIEECADGSDERPDLCTERGITDGPIETTTMPSTSDSVCVLPPYPLHGTYNATVGLKPGDAVSHTSLTYSCERGYILTGERSPICFKGNWFTKMPACEESEESDTGNVQSCGRIMSPIRANFSTVPVTSGGIDPKYIEFPWIVAVFVPTTHVECALTDNYCWVFRCGGSLIGPKVVLVPAKYVFYYKQHKLKVRAGDWNLHTFEEQLPYQEQFVNKMIFHPQYHDSQNAAELRYDAALLVMESSYTLADNVAFICLPPPDLKVAPTDCKVAGWGVSIFVKSHNQALLRVVDLNYMEHDQCQRMFREILPWSSYVLGDSFRCAGSIPGKGSCKDDGGSPLMCIVNDHYYAFGIYSWGFECSRTTYPELFTDVVKIRSWIDQEMRANGFTTDTYTHVAYRK